MSSDHPCICGDARIWTLTAEATKPNNVLCPFPQISWTEMRRRLVLIERISEGQEGSDIEMDRNRLGGSLWRPLR